MHTAVLAAQAGDAVQPRCDVQSRAESAAAPPVRADARNIKSL